MSEENPNNPVPSEIPDLFFVSIVNQYLEYCKENSLTPSSKDLESYICDGEYLSTIIEVCTEIFEDKKL